MLHSICNSFRQIQSLKLGQKLTEECIEFAKKSSKKKIRIDGITDKIVNEKQFGEPRGKSWKSKIIPKNIEALDIY